MKASTFFLSLVLSLSAFHVSAQYGGTSPNSFVQNDFMNSSLLVLETGNEAFDAKIKSGFEKYWKLTPYEIVSSVSADQWTNPKYSILSAFTLEVEEGDYTQTYGLYGISVGGKGELLKRVVTYILMDEFGFENEIGDMTFRAENMVKLMHDFTEMRNDNKAISGATWTRVRYSTGPLYNAKHKVIKGKTLLVQKRSLVQQAAGMGGKKEMTEEEFKTLYGGPVKFVSTEEFTEALETNNPDYVCFQPVYSRKKYIFLIDCETGSICYELYATSGVFFNKKDLANMKEAMGK